MGLDRRAVAFLATAHRLGVDFEQTLMLGRQNLMVDDVGAAFAAAGSTLPVPPPSEGPYADDLLRHMGARVVDSVDASDWEGATIIHDLNTPLPPELAGRYSLIIDGGTLEHVFEYPTALRSALEAVRVGGHFVTITPTNNWCGHGFYQFSPELFYGLLNEANGYRVRAMLIRSLAGSTTFFQVPDPAAVGRRMELHSFGPMLLYVLAERIADVPVRGMQQSDYEARWAGPLPEVRKRRSKQFIPSRFHDAARELWWASWMVRRYARTEPDLKPVSLAHL